MSAKSVFFAEWRNSLREQYKHVLRIDDQVTLPSLTEVMRSVGFDDEELRQLQSDAGASHDENQEDCVPDLASPPPEPPIPAAEASFQIDEPDADEPATYADSLESESADATDESTSEVAHEAADALDDPDVPLQQSLF